MAKDSCHDTELVRVALWGQRGEEELGGWCNSTSLFPKHSCAIKGEAKVLQTLKSGKQTVAMR